MKKKIVYVLIFFIGIAFSLNAQNVGIGTNNPTAKLTVNGNLALLSDTVKINCGIFPSKLLINNTNKPKSLFHIINDGCSSFFPPNIAGLSGGTDGKLVTIITHLNGTSIQHLQSIVSTPTTQDSANMIELYEPNNNGSINQPNNISLNAGGSCTLIYDGIRNRWKLLSYSGDIKSVVTGWLTSPNPNDIYNPNSGNVGIGTGIPSQKLDIAGNVKVRNDLLIDGNTGIATANPAYPLTITNDDVGYFQQNTLTDANIIIGVDNARKAGFVGTLSNTGLEIGTAAAIAITISPARNVGIGTLSPNASLSVTRGNGTDGTAAFFGTTNASHFNYSSSEDTYIRGGKNTSKLFLNDYGGQVSIGTATTGAAQLNIVSHTSGGNANALSIMQNTTNTGNDSYGMYSYTGGSNTSNYGIAADVNTSGQTDNYAGYFQVYGSSTPGHHAGIESFATGSTTFNYGIRGISGGTANYNTGGMFIANMTGIPGSENDGIFATAANGSTNNAGVFDGDVAVIGFLSKSGGSFKIDHPQDPENKYLYHSFVESPDMMNVYNGNIVTDANGVAFVQLPDYFNALNKDFRYQLTTIGQPAQVYIMEEINSNNQFTIKADKPNTKISWQVTGIRQDAWANAHRIIPEVEKEERNKGKYLSPEVFNKPKQQGIYYNRIPQLKNIKKIKN
ncbi:hypothetical protein BH11BAC4_BH11BAC4_11800 [soil metagenome]